MATKLTQRLLQIVIENSRLRHDVRRLQARIAFLEQHCDCPPPPPPRAVGLACTANETASSHTTRSPAVQAVWVWGNAEKVLRETPPSCSNLPTKSFPFSEKVFMPGSLLGTWPV